MPSPPFDSKEIAAFRKQEGVLPSSAPLLDGPPPAHINNPVDKLPTQSLDMVSHFALPRAALPTEPAGDKHLLNDLLSLSGAAFVTQAYREVLGREADPEGLSNFTGKLGKGELAPLEVLGRLRYSREGRAYGRKMRGLFPRYALLVAGRLPAVGPLIRIVAPAPKEPREDAGLDGEVARLRATLRSMSASHNAMAEILEGLLQELVARDAKITEESERLAASEQWERGQAVGELVRRIDEERKARRESALAVTMNLDALKTDIGREILAMDKKQAGAERAIAAHGTSLISLDRRIGRFEQDAPLPVPDSFHAALQDRFRGDAEVVRTRLSVYLPYIKQAGAGTEALPILDLGCGRGEWLSLLHEGGFDACGVDESHTAVEICSGLGLRVALGDALQHMKGMPAHSLGAVTAFHILEHLDTGRVLAIFAEARRALAPGGILLVEMPNPENLRIAACFFYLDPTHRHPIPKELAQFFAERAGFEVLDVLPLNPFPPEEWPASESFNSEVGRWLYGPRDYGLVAMVPTKVSMRDS